MKLNFAAILLAFLFLALPLYSKSYSIPHAQIDYYMNSDGSIFVFENITYSLESGQFTQLYLQKPMDLQIENATGACFPNSCRFFEQNNQGWHELVLESDFNSPQTANAVFEYKLNNQILNQKDTSQFFYKLWGETWSEEVETLEARIHLPFGFYDYEFFIHPPLRTYEVDAGHSTIKIISKNHPAYTYLEANLLFPPDTFSPDLPNAKNYMTKKEIIYGEKEYSQNQQNAQLIGLFLFLLPWAVISLSFIVLYFIYGREVPLSKLGYNSIYERDIPKELSAAQAGYILNPQNNPNLISAELLMLEHLGCIKLTTKKEPGLLGESTQVYVQILNSDSSKLKAHQRTLLNHIISSRVSFSAFDSLLSIINPNANSVISKNSGSSFKLSNMSSNNILAAKFYSKFFEQINSESENNYLDTTANKIMGIITGLTQIFFMVYLVFLAPDENFVVYSFVSIFASSLLFGILLSKKQILGRWTIKGRVFEQKCINFKKYLNDFGSFKKKDIAQVKLWDEYLIYATAFGIADKVLKTLKTADPAYYKANSSHFTRMALTSIAVSSISNSIASASRSGGSSSGGFGGGSGGGGGGGGAR